MAEEKGKKKITRRKVMYYGTLVVMLLCVLLIVFLLLFQIRKIKIEGNKYSSASDIQAWLQEDELSTNSLYLMWKYHFTDMELLPTMKEADLKMINPWTLQLDVTDKTVVGYIEIGDDCVYFDEEGRVLAQTAEWWDDVPRVDGLNISEVTLYEELPVSKENKKAFKSLLEISATLEKYELSPSKLEVDGSDVYLYFGNKCVIVGNENIENRIAQITPIMEKLGEQSGTLHLENYDSENTIISFEKDVLPTHDADTTVADAGDAGTEDGDDSAPTDDGNGE